MPEVSAKYRKLNSQEVEAVAAGVGWLDCTIPKCQYEACVKPELEAWVKGIPIAPFKALVQCVKELPVCDEITSVLEVGASSGYNCEVLRIAGFFFNYTALDFSPAYKALAGRLWPDLKFQIGDARLLPYQAGEFDVVLSGGVLLHVREYEQVAWETARVAGKFAIFHRTPVWNQPTSYYVKEAYGVPCLEIHFNESELMALLETCGLPVMASFDVGAPSPEGLQVRSYVCSKGLFHHQV